MKIIDTFKKWLYKILKIEEYENSIEFFVSENKDFIDTIKMYFDLYDSEIIIIAIEPNKDYKIYFDNIDNFECIEKTTNDTVFVRLTKEQSSYLPLGMFPKYKLVLNKTSKNNFN